jgi:hypothetical protein
MRQPCTKHSATAATKRSSHASSNCDTCVGVSVRRCTFGTRGGRTFFGHVLLGEAHRLVEQLDQQRARVPRSGSGAIIDRPRDERGCLIGPKCAHRDVAEVCACKLELLGEGRPGRAAHAVAGDVVHPPAGQRGHGGAGMEALGQRREPGRLGCRGDVPVTRCLGCSASPAGRAADLAIGLVPRRDPNAGRERAETPSRRWTGIEPGRPGHGWWCPVGVSPAQAVFLLDRRSLS